MVTLEFPKKYLIELLSFKRLKIDVEIDRKRIIWIYKDENTVDKSEKMTYAHLGLIVNIFIAKWGYHNSIIRQFSFYWKLDPLSTLSWHGANVR